MYHQFKHAEFKHGWRDKSYIKQYYNLYHACQKKDNKRIMEVLNFKLLHTKEAKAWKNILHELYKKGLSRTFLKFERVINYLYQLLDDMNTHEKDTKALQTNLDAFEKVAKEVAWHPYTPENPYWSHEQMFITFAVWDILAASWENKNRGTGKVLKRGESKTWNDAETYAKKNPFKGANHPKIYNHEFHWRKPSKNNVEHGYFSKINNGLS